VKTLLSREAFFILVGLGVGLFMGNSFLNMNPAFFGWLFSIGMGISGGAFVAAISRNIPLIGGSLPSKQKQAPSHTKSEN
jgi:uncharacterized membrane protein YadS